MRLSVDHIIERALSGGPLHQRAAMLNSLWLRQNDTDGVTDEVDAACRRISALLIDHAERAEGTDLAETAIAISEMALRGYITPAERANAYRRLRQSDDHGWQTDQARLRVYLSESWLTQNEHTDGQKHYANTLSQWSLAQQPDGTWPGITEAEALGRIDIISRINDTVPRQQRIAMLRAAGARYRSAALHYVTGLRP